MTASLVAVGTQHYGYWPEEGGRYVTL